MNNKQLTKLINEGNNIPILLEQLPQEKVLKLITYLSDKYYNEQNVVTDAQYDEIHDYYTQKYGQLVEVGAKVKKDEFTLPIYMNSLDKIKTPEEIELFKKRNGQHYVISAKLDGISTLLIKKGNEIRFATRGDGFIGKDITHVLPLIDIDISKLTENDVMIRGELVISKADFAKINTDGYYTHPRNFVISVTNSKKSIKPDMLKHVSFIPYFAVINNTFTMKKSEQLAFIASKQFNNKILATTTTDNLNYDSLIAYYKQLSDTYGYVLDGLVVSNNDSAFPVISGEKYPKHEIAFKHAFEEDEKETTVTNIEWNISKNGLLKPTVNFDPVVIDGYVIKNATGNNAQFMLDAGIGVGAKIMVILGGDVIPRIVSVKTAVQVVLPENVTWEGVDIKPNNLSIDEKKSMVIKQMTYFCGTIGIDYLRDKTMERVIDTIIEKKGNNYLNFNEDLQHNVLFEFCQFKFEDFMTVPRFGVESSLKAFGELKKLQGVSIEKIMDASQMFKRIGEKKLKLLFGVYPNFLEMYAKGEVTVDLLNLIKGYDTITSNQIIEGMATFAPWLEKFKQLIPNLVLLVNVANAITANNEFSQFKGMKIVFTGFRDKDAESKIEKAGGKVVTSVSKNTNLVVAKDVNENSSKIKNAQELGIRIISQEEFYEMLVGEMREG
jgi:DNA ligase (NAD+)